MIVFALLLLTLSSVASAQVRVWEEDVVIPTYPLAPDDVNPHFFALEGSVIYPYTMQDNLTPVKVDRTYRGVVSRERIFEAHGAPRDRRPYSIRV